MRYEKRDEGKSERRFQSVSVPVELKIKMNNAALKYKINWSAAAIAAFQQVVDDIEAQENET